MKRVLDTSRETKKQTMIEILEKLGACAEAVSWAQDYPSLEEAWQACPRGDWLLWYIGKLSGPPEPEKRRKLVLTTCECVRLIFNPNTDHRVVACIETAERWARGEATISELRTVRMAADAAAAAAYAAADAAAAAAAYAAAYAAYAADAAAAAADAADAAAAAAAAYAADVSYTAYAASKNEFLLKCADIVRSHYPTPPARDAI